MAVLEQEPDPMALLHMRIGAASPLWALFTGMAMTGAAWWWTWRWMQPQNREAAFALVDASNSDLRTEIATEMTPMLRAPAALYAVVEEVLDEAEPAMAAVAVARVARAVTEPPAELAAALMEGAPIAKTPAAPEPVSAEPAAAKKKKATSKLA